MARLVWLVMFGAGCLNIPPPATTTDGGVDGPKFQPNCYGIGLTAFDPICNPDAQPSLELSDQVSTGYVLAPDPQCLVHVQQDTGGTPVCVLVANTITVTSNVKVLGELSLVLIATDRLTIEGGGNLDLVTSFASNNGDCLSRPGTDSTSGSGGGAGGAFHGAGGAGGQGFAASVAGGSQIAGLVAAPTFLRNGCPGSSSGRGSSISDGGDSGSAVYVIAGTEIDVIGVIDASGGGAEQSAVATGGGGGGSGGMIVLEAPTVHLTSQAVVYSDGGGGAGGSTAVSGAAGNDPDIATAVTGAAGGAGSSGGPDPSNGGAGSSQTVLDGGSGLSGTDTSGMGLDGGGGGGGGGAGFILIYSDTEIADTGSIVSPP